ncbi:helix-turn-helix domain-containing protein [bacterium]|nr:helix-turn-helix domain-containing protein [bacterium]
MTNSKATQQPNDLKNIGLILKKKREELSYTLEHVSEITRITLTCLRNIEDGNMSALPGLVFIRGFIRNYAKLLGLESDWMIEALNQVYSAGDDKQHPKSEQHQREIGKSDKPNNNLVYYFMGAAAVVGLLIVAIIIYKRPMDRLNLNQESVETIQAVASQNESVESKPLGIIIPEEEIVQPKTAPVVTPVISPLSLTLVAAEDEWIRLAIDNQDPFELKLKKNEKYEWPAEEEYSLIMTTGKTASVHLNGEEIVDRENYLNKLFEAKLNKFTLKQINNR